MMDEKKKKKERKSVSRALTHQTFISYAKLIIFFHMPCECRVDATYHPIIVWFMYYVIVCVDALICE